MCGVLSRVPCMSVLGLFPPCFVSHIFPECNQVLVCRRHWLRARVGEQEGSPYLHCSDDDYTYTKKKLLRCGRDILPTVTKFRGAGPRVRAPRATHKALTDKFEIEKQNKTKQEAASKTMEERKGETDHTGAPSIR